MRCPARIVIAILLVVFFPGNTKADDAAARTELTLFGVGGPDGHTSVKIDAGQLAELPQQNYPVETPWTDGVIQFTGPLLRDILQAFDVENTENGELTLHAFNDYSVSIPLSDAFDHLPILAMHRDGVPMTIRDNGPYWLIYPWHQEKSLRNEIYYARSVWMLKSISISNGGNAQ